MSSHFRAQQCKPDHAAHPRGIFYLIICIMSKLDHDGAIYFKSIALIKEGIDALVNFNAAHFSE